MSTSLSGSEILVFTALGAAAVAALLAIVAIALSSLAFRASSAAVAVAPVMARLEAIAEQLRHAQASMLSTSRHSFSQETAAAPARAEPLAGTVPIVPVSEPLRSGTATTTSQANGEAAATSRLRTDTVAVAPYLPDPGHSVRLIDLLRMMDRFGTRRAPEQLWDELKTLEQTGKVTLWGDFGPDARVQTREMRER